MIQTSATFNAALQIAQQGVTLLAKWADPQLANKCPRLIDDNIVTKAKQILFWNDQHELNTLRLLFDHVKLDKGQDKQYYWQPKAIENSNPTIPYPQLEAATDFSNLKTEIKSAIDHLNDDDWQNLSLLTLIIEKFGSFLSLGESDVALVDIAKTTAAVAAAIANNSNATELNLIAGDLSGIQKFIYTISSDGALKSLRARSFYLELVIEEVVQQLLIGLKLPRTNIIYAGGGNLYILADGTENTKKTVEQVREQFNEWLLKEFEGKVFLALDCLKFSIADIATAMSTHWSDATTQLGVYKYRKFANQISKFTEPRDSHEPCGVCHRDDVETLKPLNPNEPNSALACGTCCRMFRLGGRMFGIKVIIRSPREDIKDKLDTLSFEISGTKVYYHLFQKWKQIVPDSDTALLVNDWTLEHYQFKNFRNAFPLLLGNYGQQSQEESDEVEGTIGFMRAGEMAQQAKGIKRVGYLRMDVDRLGQIFAEGLGRKQTLPRLAGLSRQMSYFFKVYLNSLAKKRQENFLDNCKNNNIGVLNNAECLTAGERKNLLFIYSGGDDLFVSGAWNEIVEFAFDVYQCFRAYTGYNPDISLSAGISIDNAKSPLYHAASVSGEAEKAAKANGRDSLGLFGQVFKWDEWLGIKDTNIIDFEIKQYLHPETKPNLLGILPFVKRLEQQNIGVNYSRNFVRNLLITAQIQEEALKKFEEDKQSKEALGTRYYLHLPKIAYTLARLPKYVLDDSDFRTSLKSPYNAPYFRAIATWIELLNR
ncbi:type III-A CRISPR-associated protein Cas10/Csm1 [Nostoc sp. WHI]|uniref:type III-A CRISPR-associated protein Cas10/Csm1 n=1 Tax=Nostoc sp. WHI TaxID=2650611 RepID=UPI0018C748F8|nr:type III-A CRISPR-associated protein Cas10/Csm1 [Nostoc sp. WHI]MBG1271163.1 type III-A CRISPR-associated protein Cas10/Csm1 [Nostoc sp. WHI]